MGQSTYTLVLWGGLVAEFFEGQSSYAVAVGQSSTMCGLRAV